MKADSNSLEERLVRSPIEEFCASSRPMALPYRARLILMLLLAWPGLAWAQVPSVELPPELARVLTDYEEAWQARDPAALAALFAEDGFVLSGGSPPIHGRDAIEEHYNGSGGELALRAFAYATEGSVGYIIGGYSRRREDPDSGKFTLTLKRTDGKWLIMSDMDNGNSRN